MFNFLRPKRPQEPKSQAFSFLGLDLHNHILPGIDDGSPNSETSQALLQGLQWLGFNRFIHTPHILPGVHNNTPDTIAVAHQNLTNAIAQKDTAALARAAAAEYMLDSEMLPAIRSKTLLVLAPDRPLVEMSYLSKPPNLDELLFELQIQGYRPVLAHPERYNFYQKDLDGLLALHDRGLSFQANLLSFTGYYGKEVMQRAHYLLDHSYYSLAGTDLHHERHLQSLMAMSGNPKLMEKLQAYGFENAQWPMPTNR